MDNVFCTLFDSNYLDKGLVLYDSMIEHIPDFKLYVFAFDDKCFEILKNERTEKLIPVKIEALEERYPCLIEARKNRNNVEYNWTCSSWIIKYVLEFFGEPICTYIDADMKFFSSPNGIFKMMRNKGCSTIIVPHRFHNDYYEQKEGPKTGYYCVEFNTFVNDENGRKALDWWAEQCCKWCYYVIPSINQWYGDQKYLNEFPKRFNGVYICDQYGVGLGPWNDNRMKLGTIFENEINIIDKDTNKRYPLIVYHFAGVRFLNANLIKVSSRMNDRLLHRYVYDDYIKDIMRKRKYIEKKYGLEIIRSWNVPAKNPMVRIYQRYIMPMFKIRHLYNLYIVKNKEY